MSIVSFTEVSADTISHPDGSGKSPLYVDGIILDVAASAALGQLNINSTSEELQSNDQGTTRPLMAKAAAIDNLDTSTGGAATAFLADTWTNVPLVWPDYTHKVLNPGQRHESEYENGPIVFYAHGSAGIGDFVAFRDKSFTVFNMFSKDSSESAFKTSWISIDDFEQELTGGATTVAVRSNAAGTVAITANYVGLYDGRGKRFS